MSSPVLHGSIPSLPGKSGNCVALTAYAIAGRRREFGVRLASAPRPVRSSRWCCATAWLSRRRGVALGVAASLAASRVIRGAVFEVSPTDPIVSAGTIVIVLIAIAATYFPARGAARIDAARTLRME